MNTDITYGAVYVFGILPIFLLELPFSICYFIT